MTNAMIDGGYDEGYKACPCFWGRDPGSLVEKLLARVDSVKNWRVLDLGCGEGKNSAALARRGARVTGVDCSMSALTNARDAWPDVNVTWLCSDIRNLSMSESSYNAVILYGVLHCLSSLEEVRHTVLKAMNATKPGGYNIVCTFNDREQDLRAHPGFEPCLLDHGFYRDLYASWELLEESDQDLREVHPHNRISHVHSMTRLLGRRPQ